MRFTVVWKQSAERALAEIWLASRDREEVRSAADDLDRLLGQNPRELGESRGGDVRLLVRPPLVVLYSVSDDDRVVRVLRVRHVRQLEHDGGSNGVG